jgi:hypothetical protein
MPEAPHIVAFGGGGFSMEVYGLDDQAGLLFRGREPVEAVSARPARPRS